MVKKYNTPTKKTIIKLKFNVYLILILDNTCRVATWSGSQERSRKTKKKEEIQSKKARKSQEIFFLKTSDFVNSNLQNSLYLYAFSW